VPITDDELTRG